MSLRWFELQFPSELSHEAVLHFTRSLAVRPRRGLLMNADPVAVEVSGADGALTWLLGASSRDQGQVLAALRQALPDVHAEPTNRAPVRTPAWEIRLSSPRRSLRTDMSDQVAGALLSALTAARRDEEIRVQWLIGPWLHRPVVPPATTKKPDSNPLLDLDRLVLDSEQAKALRDKHAEPLFGVVGRIAVKAATTHRTRSLRQGVMGALQLLRTPGTGFERRLLPTFFATRRADRLKHPVIAWPAALNAAELAACLGFPIGNPVLAGVTYSGHRHLPPATGSVIAVDRRGDVPRHLRVTGRSTFPAQPGPVTLSDRDGLQHVHCIGPTGVGKSTWLASMALQDIEAGRSVVVVDPKNDLVEAIADRIPEHRLSDVVLLDPTSTTPVGFNVLNTAEPELAVDNVLHVFRELFSANWGQRTADVMHNSLLTLVGIKGMTLCELPTLLQSREFRRHVVEQLGESMFSVKPFWHAYERLSEPQRTEVIAPTLNKLRPFITRSTVRGVIGQSHGFDLMDVFTKRRILLVSLAKGNVGSEGAHLLGSLLLGSLFSVIQRRSQITPERRHPTFVYLDEFADVLRLPLDLGDALAQARGLGVGLVLAHQNLSQLPPAVKAATMANARSKIVYQCGHDDAAVFAKTLGSGLKPSDIQGLRAFETYQALTVGGRTTSPASVATLPLGEPLGTLAEVRRLSAERYGVDRSTTDEAIRNRQRMGTSTDTEIGTRRHRSAT